jgi:hypothetical protein
MEVFFFSHPICSVELVNQKESLRILILKNSVIPAKRLAIIIHLIMVSMFGPRLDLRDLLSLHFYLLLPNPVPFTIMITLQDLDLTVPTFRTHDLPSQIKLITVLHPQIEFITVLRLHIKLITVLRPQIKLITVLRLRSLRRRLN